MVKAVRRNAMATKRRIFMEVLSEKDRADSSVCASAREGDELEPGRRQSVKRTNDNSPAVHCWGHVARRFESVKRTAEG